MDLLSGHFHKSPTSNRIRDKRQRKQDFVAGQFTDVDEGILTGAHPKHKSSRDPFLIWVAFERNRPRVDQQIRRTCPLADCELVFNTSEEMQQHLIGCLQVSNGMYRCYKCQGEEKIGRYHVNRCREIKNHGGPLATVKNSFRSAKRKLTPRPQLSVHHNFEDNCIQIGRGCFEKEASRDFAELQSQSSPFDVEMSGENTSKRASEMSSESYDFGCAGSHVLSHTANPQIQDRPNIELAAEPIHRPRQSWQELQSMQMLSMFQFNDLASPCSSAPPTRFHGWQIPTPISPFGGESSHSGFNQNDSFQHTPSHEQNHPQNSLPDIGLSSSTIVSEAQPWNGFSTFTCTATNHGAYDLPELSSDTESRKFSTSSGTESLPTQGYLNETNPMILQDSDMCEEPKSYNPVYELESYKNCGELANTEQKWSFPPDDNSSSFGAPPNSLWLQGSRFRASNENSKRNMGSDLDMVPNALLSSNSTPSDAPSYRSASRRLFHRTTCPCGFEPKGIPKNRRGNLKRHMRGCRTLREQAHPESSPDPKPFVCDFSNCGKKFSRCDNRAQHQKIKSHGPYASSCTSPVALDNMEGGEFETFGNFSEGGGFLR